MNAPPDMSVPSIISLHDFDAVAWSFFSVAAVTTIVRTHTRAFVVRAFGVDDVLIVIGTLATFGMCFMGHYQARALAEIFRQTLIVGPTYMRSPSGLEWWNQVFRYAFLTDAIYLLALPIIKCSILAFYRRIAVAKKHYYIIYIVGFLILGQGIANLIATIFAFDPPGAIWNVMTRPIARRYSNEKLQTVNSCFQVAFDVIILLMPIPILVTTKIRRRAKAGLIFIYCLSFFSLASTIVRLVQALQFQTETSPLVAASKRATYTVWTAIEVTTAIMCANLPALSSLLRHVSHTHKSRSGSASGTVLHVPQWVQHSWARLHSSRGSSVKSSTTSHTADVEKDGVYAGNPPPLHDLHFANAYSDGNKLSTSDDSTRNLVSPASQKTYYPRDPSRSIYRTDEFSTEVEGGAPLSSGK